MKKRVSFTRVAHVCLVSVLAVLVFMVTSTKSSPAATEIRLITAQFGSTAYLAGQGLAAEVNKTHPWLRIRVIEGGHTAVPEFVNKPEIRKNSVGQGATFTNWSAKKGWAPAKAPYDGVKALCAFTTLACTIWSTDENIRTLEDLKGKKFNLFGKTNQGGYTTKALLEHLGIFDTIKADYLVFEPAVDALLDGLVVGSVGYATLVAVEPNKFKPVPAFIRLLETRKSYLIDIPAELQRATRKATAIPIAPISVPAGSVFTGIPERDVTTFAVNIVWWADKSLPYEVAYEFLKVYADNIPAINKTSPAAASVKLKRMATTDVAPEDYHPAAIQFFKDRGIKVVNLAE